MRDRLAIFTAIAAGVFMTVQYFLTASAAAAGYRTILAWIQIIFSFALLVGVLGVIRIHGKKFILNRSERFYAGVLLAGVALMVVLGFGGGIERGSPFLWVFDHWQAPMQSTVFSLLAFYVASAAYRGFRARSGESVVLVIAALIVLLGRVPLGEWLSPYIPDVADWVLHVPALAAKRAILIGIGLGMISTSLKVILGLERTYLGGR
ncbi:MAG: hypothetical protein Kow0074_18650 [Candidatus Zixiibacteriota bacterium]